MAISVLLLEDPATTRTRKARQLPNGLGYLCVKCRSATETLLMLEAAASDAVDDDTELLLWFKNRMKAGSDNGLTPLCIKGEAAFIATSAESAALACRESEYESAVVARVAHNSAASIVTSVLKKESGLFGNSHLRDGYFLPEANPSRQLIVCDQGAASLEIFDVSERLQRLVRTALS